MQYTPIAEEYARHRGKVIDFHGWGLPLQFSGIIEEHRHVRRAAGVFDCSHMGEFLFCGTDSIAALDNLVIGDMMRLRPGRCKYTALLNDDACIIDDCVAFKTALDELLLVTNAGPLEEVGAFFQRHVPNAESLSKEMAKVDVQGPLALRVLLSLGFQKVEHLSFWSGMRTVWRGHDLTVTRAGYTGELGYELYGAAEGVVLLWRALTACPEVLPCGLGARDTLRLEMGYPLSGQDVDAARTPLEAGMDRFIAWETTFPGKARLEAQRASGAYEVLVPLRSPDKRAPRKGYELRCDDQPVGVTTSGAFGPSLGCGVGLGYVPKALARPGASLNAGPRNMKVAVESPPLYKQATGRNRIEATTT